MSERSRVHVEGMTDYQPGGFQVVLRSEKSFGAQRALRSALWGNRSVEIEVREVGEPEPHVHRWSDWELRSETHERLETVFVGHPGPHSSTGHILHETKTSAVRVCRDCGKVERVGP